MVFYAFNQQKCPSLCLRDILQHSKVLQLDTHWSKWMNVCVCVCVCVCVLVFLTLWGPVTRSTPTVWGPTTLWGPKWWAPHRFQCKLPQKPLLICLMLFFHFPHKVIKTGFECVCVYALYRPCSWERDIAADTHSHKCVRL